MPHSDVTLRPWTFTQLAALYETDHLGRVMGVQRIVDVGAGAGTAAEFYGPWFPDTEMVGIEIWEPYIDRFCLRDRYHRIIQGDARTLDLPEAEIYILGDVLEHLHKPEAIALFERVQAVSQFQVISVPIHGYEQGAMHGNCHETHLHQYDIQEVIDTFPGIFTLEAGDIVGAFIARSQDEG